MKTVFLLLAMLSTQLRAADVEVSYDERLATLSAAQKARIEAVRSLWDWLLLDNGLTGASSVARLVIKPSHLGAGGPLASSVTASYKFNRRGKLVMDGQYPATISMNIDQGMGKWTDVLTGAVVFHEMAHCFGMDEACFLINKYEGGTAEVPDEHYTGAGALAVYRAEYDPGATFIPLDGPHFAESVDPDEILTPYLSISGVANVHVSATLLAIIQENGWNVRPGFTGGMLRLLTPMRRLRDEDMSSR